MWNSGVIKYNFSKKRGGGWLKKGWYYLLLPAVSGAQERSSFSKKIR
jgi:hypothetical protein